MTSQEAVQVQGRLKYTSQVPLTSKQAAGQMLIASDMVVESFYYTLNMKYSGMCMQNNSH
jgi:hypothetical protein